jgi:acetylornithine deacetylase
VAEIKDLLLSHLTRIDDVECDPPWVCMPPLSPHASQWIEPVAGAIAVATGRRPDVMGVPFGTDAGPLSANGTPCLVFGPGDIDQAHTQNEWIELEQVHLAAEAYYQIAASLGRVEVR